jgi:hypothetical protein
MSMSINLQNCRHGESELPIWWHLEQFTAQTTSFEKISHVAHYALFAYALLEGPIRQVTGRKLKGLSALVTLLVLRKALCVAVGLVAYKAIWLSKSKLEKCAAKAHRVLQAQGYLVKELCFEKLDSRFAATVIASSETIGNGKWVINALGVTSAMEKKLKMLVARNSSWGFNTLVVNGPAVGCSKGLPTPHQLGAGYEAAMQFLECEVAASHIIFYGHSWGGGTLAKAVLNHDFRYGQLEGIKYLFVGDRTFSSFASIAAHRTFPLMRHIFRAVGFDLDGIAAAHRLTELGIQQVVIDAEGDTVIPSNVSLSRGLGMFTECGPAVAVADKIFIKEEMAHSGPLSAKVEEKVKALVSHFSSDAELEKI